MAALFRNDVSISGCNIILVCWHDCTDVSGVETASLPDAAPKTGILKIQILNKKKKKNFVGSSIINDK